LLKTQKNKLSVLAEWWPILLGLAVLYLPMYLRLSTTLWLDPQQGQGPIVLGIVCFLVWEKRAFWFQNSCSAAPLSDASSKNTILTPNQYWESVVGLVFLIFGLLFNVIGRSQEIFLLEIGSQIPVFLGILMMTRGVSGVRAMRFPLFFMLFMLPLPGFVINAVTMPMKIGISYLVENLLFWLDYPISREGVVLQIGQYQLLVADACAGIHTLLSMEAMGILYLHLVKHGSLLRNLTLATLIIPISFMANAIRVMVLVLITYYYGDSAAQGFTHEFAGILLFVVGLSMTIMVDATVQALARWRAGASRGDRLA